MIGKGGYGVVYEVVRLDSPTTRFACKAELAVAHNNLKTEWDLMTLLKDNKSKHNIIGVELGAERNFNYIIMHLVGPSLAELRKSIPKKVSSIGRFGAALNTSRNLLCSRQRCVQSSASTLSRNFINSGTFTET